MESRTQSTDHDSSGQRLIARVRVHCRLKGWDLGDLARQADVSRTTLYHLEQGKTRWPHGSTMRKIARALGIRPEQLWVERTRTLSPVSPLTANLGVDEAMSTRERQRAFDRSTNPVVEEVFQEEPELFSGWMSHEWDELYSTFGTGGQLSRTGVLESAAKINRKRETMQQLHVVLETHLGDVAANLIDALYQMVRPANHLAATADLNELTSQQHAEPNEVSESSTE